MLSNLRNLLMKTENEMVKAYETHVNKLVAPDPKLKRPRFDKGKRVFNSPDDFMFESFNDYAMYPNQMHDPHVTFYGKPAKRNLDGGVSKHAVLSAETYPHGRVLFSYGMPIALKTNSGKVQAIPYHLLPTVTTKRHGAMLTLETQEVPYIPNTREELISPRLMRDRVEYHTDRVEYHLKRAARARAPNRIEGALEDAWCEASALRDLGKLPTEPLITQFVTLKKIAMWRLVKEVEIPPILWEKK